MVQALRTSLRYGGLRQGGLQPGLGGDSIFATASLDLNFAVNKNLGTLVDATTGTNLVDFTRASSGTYVDSDGLIKTATTNLYLYSQDFSNPYWTKLNVLPFGSGSISGATTAPDGTVTADLIVEDTSASTSHGINLTTLNLVNGAKYTRSVYAKAKERSQIGLNFGQGLSGFLLFDIPSKTFLFSGGLDDLGYESLPDGWVRVWMTSTANTSTFSYSVTQIRIGKDGATSYTGDGTSGIYIWGSQLEQSSTVGEYIKTTSTINSAPRFDHDPTTGESLGLLVEEQRQNLLLQSEDFSTTWTPTNTTVATNQIAAPDGAITADKIVETATTAEHNIRQDTASQSAGTYTFSIFAKAAERNVIQFVSTGVLGGFRANFDLANGVLGSVDAPQLTASIIPFPDGWYRCVVTATSTTAGALRAQWNIVTSPTSARVESYLGDTSKGLYLWGAQLE